VDRVSGSGWGPVPRSFPRSALIFVGFALAATLWTLPVWGHPTTSWLGVGGDPESAMWYLAWWPFAISHLIFPWFTTRLGYPSGVNLTWNPSAPLLGLVGWPVELIGGVVLEYNVVLTLGLAANAWAGYVACAHWVRRRRWAVLGGLLFGMSPWIMSEAYSHASLVIAPGVPLMLVALDEAWRRRGWSVWQAALAIAGAGYLTLLISETAYASLALMVAAIGIWAGWCGRRTWRLWLGRVAGSGVLALALMAPLLGVILWVQLGWPGSVSGQTMPLTLFSADLTRFFVPGLTELAAIPSLISPITSFLGTLSQAGLYIGLPFLALLVVAWRFRIGRPWLGGITVGLAVAAVLSLGPVLHVWGHAVGPPLPGTLLADLPLLRELVPDWFGIYLGLGVALAAAIVLDRTTTSPTLSRWLRPLAIVAVVSWLPFALPVSTTLVPAVFKTTALGSRAVVAFGPADSSTASDSPMLWQAVADFDFSTIGAYRVGRDFADDYPGELPPFERAMVELQHGRETWSQALRSRQRVLHELAVDRVTLVVVGPMTHESAAVHFVSALLGRSGRWIDGVWVWHLGRPA